MGQVSVEICPYQGQFLMQLNSQVIQIESDGCVALLPKGRSADAARWQRWFPEASRRAMD